MICMHTRYNAKGSWYTWCMFSSHLHARNIFALLLQLPPFGNSDPSYIAGTPILSPSQLLIVHAFIFYSGEGSAFSLPSSTSI